MTALPVPSRLGELEGVIERGLATFVDVGAALLEIRDSRLYRESHGTFEDYCRERWDFSRPRAYQLIQAAEVGTLVSTTVDTPISSERIARELAPLRDEPERLREAWETAVEQHGPAPTAKEVREVVSPLTRSQLSNQRGGTDEWATPQDFYDAVDAEFGFELDVCALDSSAKCERYFTPETDGLAQDWTGTVWMNPPYGDAIGGWVLKAWESAQAGATVACLLPARVDTGWWWDYCRYGEVRFLRGRLRFGESTTSAPFPSVLVIFGPGRDACVKWWEWR
jgi:phage N-6-adenine-methyltransferase